MSTPAGILIQGSVTALEKTTAFIVRSGIALTCSTVALRATQELALRVATGIADRLPNSRFSNTYKLTGDCQTKLGINDTVMTKKSAKDLVIQLAAFAVIGAISWEVANKLFGTAPAFYNKVFSVVAHPLRITTDESWAAALNGVANDGKDLIKSAQAYYKRS